LMPSNPHCGTC